MSGERWLPADPTVQWRQQRVGWASQAITDALSEAPAMTRTGFICGTLLLAQKRHNPALENTSDVLKSNSVQVFDCALDEEELKSINQAWAKYFESITDAWSDYLTSPDGKSALRLLHEPFTTVIETAERLVFLAQGRELFLTMAPPTLGATMN